MQQRQQEPQEDVWKAQTQTKTFRYSLLWLVAFYLGEIGLIFLFLALRFGREMVWGQFFGLVLFATLASSLLVAAFPLQSLAFLHPGDTSWAFLLTYSSYVPLLASDPGSSRTAPSVRAAPCATV